MIGVEISIAIGSDVETWNGTSEKTSADAKMKNDVERESVSAERCDGKMTGEGNEESESFKAISTGATSNGGPENDYIDAETDVETER